MTKELLMVQLKGLQTQLAVLEAQVEGAERAGEPGPFANLQGWLREQSACSEPDFAAVEYRIPDLREP
jgi:hypothetical protein